MSSAAERAGCSEQFVIICCCSEGLGALALELELELAERHDVHSVLCASTSTVGHALERGGDLLACRSKGTSHPTFLRLSGVRLGCEALQGSRRAPQPVLPLRPCFYRYASKFRGVMHLLRSLLNFILCHHSPSGAAYTHHGNSLRDVCFGIRQSTGSGQREAAPSRARTGMLWEIDMFEMFERQ